MKHVAAWAVAGLGLALSSIAAAQPALVADGNAAVTGFSGVTPPTLLPPGVNPADRTVINLNAPVLRILELQAPGAPPAGQLITVQKPFSVTSGQIGQVFAVALDNARPPNVYAAATSVYGLPIVVPDANGDGLPDRAEQGVSNARFMDGLFGPQNQQGGPGSIWRIDGSNGSVSLFANVSLDNVPNSGAALGGLAFDPATGSLFAADRETGMIHRFDMTGAERGRYDHGVQGRQAGGLAPAPFDPAQRLNIAGPPFQPADPGTWGYAPPARRVFGLAVREGRLYYAVADGLQIWSVSLGPDAFGADARMEVAVPPGPSASEISKIAFDGQGRMLLAERVAPSGAFDYAALTETGGGRVLRYAPSTGAPGQLWQPAAGDPETGLDASRTGNGGVAVGYGYDAGFRRNAGDCGGAVWWTGEQLAPTTGQAVNGIQGRPAGAGASWLIDFDDRLDDPQTRGHMGDIAIHRPCAPDAQMAGGPPPGQPGEPPPEGVPPAPLPEDVVLGPPPEGAWPGPWGPWPVGPWPDGGPPPPPPICPVGTHLEQGGATNGPRQCCPVVGGVTTTPGFNGQCQSHCANAPPGPPDPKDNLTCELGFQAGHGPTGAGPIWGPLDGGGPGALICWNGQAPASFGFGGSHWAKKCPKPPLAQCQAGFQLQYASPANPATAAWEWSNARCVPSPAQAGCGPGQQVGSNGTCADLCPAGQRAFPVNRCCLNGTAPNVQGQCNPGIFVPPLWYLDYVATGTGECVVPPGNPPACSFYEFTITARQRFGRGSLIQRITLPARSALEARITRGSKYCPASAWSCSKNGDVLTCSADQCGLEPGDQVVLRLDGRVAPDLTEAPPAPIERTACGVLDWQAMSGPGAAVIEQIRDLGRVTPPPRQPSEGVGTDQYGRVSSKQACWTIRIRGERPPPPPACAPNYVATPDGQCCLASQATQSGQCCAPGSRPDAQRQRCVQVERYPVVPPPVIDAGCPPGTYRVDRRCVPQVQPCPPGTYRMGERCLPQVQPCPQGTHRVGRRCVPDVVVQPCPQGMHRVGRRCVPDVVVQPCPQGMHRVGMRCVPDVVVRPCPSGTHRVGNRCVPELRACPIGMQRIGRRCVPRPDLTRPRPPRPGINRLQPSRRQAVQQRRRGAVRR